MPEIKTYIRGKNKAEDSDKPDNLLFEIATKNVKIQKWKSEFSNYNNFTISKFFNKGSKDDPEYKSEKINLFKSEINALMQLFKYWQEINNTLPKETEQETIDKDKGVK